MDQVPTLDRNDKTMKRFSSHLLSLYYAIVGLRLLLHGSFGAKALLAVRRQLIPETPLSYALLPVILQPLRIVYCEEILG